jgi:hypothetical protein
MPKTANSKPLDPRPSSLRSRKKNIRVKEPVETAAGSIVILLISASVWAAQAAR